MALSLTYYLTVLAIKVKGVKKSFSKNPVDYLRLRKDNVPYPKGSFYKAENVILSHIGDTKVTEIKKSPDKLLVFVHGGAFVSGPVQHHWDTVKKLSKRTNFSIWLCDYPKAPENKLSTINRNIDEVYRVARSRYKEVVLIGDSVGGTLILTLTQRLLKKEEELPSKLILLSPVVDASFTNPDIHQVEPKDPMLAKVGVVSAKMMCIEDEDLKNKSVSPLYGSFAGFPQTHLFLAEYDISYPDQLLLYKELEKEKINMTILIGEKMPHIWPLLPIMKEASEALDKIIELLVD